MEVGVLHGGERGCDGSGGVSGGGVSEEEAVAIRRDAEVADLFNRVFNSDGFISKINEPWSGVDGFMYSALSHSRRQVQGIPQLYPANEATSPPPVHIPRSLHIPHIPSYIPHTHSNSNNSKNAKSRIPRAIMLEVRQDLLVDKKWRAKFAESLEKILRQQQIY
eukprot:TRINITY_DN8267_c0_g1_i1.p1 TRINITY_DN8267_c0_g1~~TRINITY_DN8267_c0_g1_i1.p1  ORF type:complete len:177 (+),score=42.04 TRINITY_DN8267_c0_g1_i1:40-531(+)